MIVSVMIREQPEVFLLISTKQTAADCNGCRVDPFFFFLMPPFTLTGPQIGPQIGPGCRRATVKETLPIIGTITL